MNGNGKTTAKHDNGGESQEKVIGNYISLTSCQTTKKFIMVSKAFVFVTRAV
jgi:hypothetical protein